MIVGASVPMLASSVVRGLQSSFTGTQALTFKGKTAYRRQVSRWCSPRSVLFSDGLRVPLVARHDIDLVALDLA
jgi:hypothetical protein